MNVTVMEGTNTFGGVIKYGVPEFRLPKEIVARKLAGLHDLEIDFEPNVKIDADILEEMVKNYDAVFMGTGVGKPKMLTNEGHELKGIMNAMKFLVNLNQSALPMISPGEKVVVVGAGYVGLDAARSAIRLGGKVTCITMATKEESYAAVVEKDYLEAEEEGVKFIFGVQVEKFEGNEHVEKVHYKNSESGVLEADKVIIAIGQQHDNESLKNIIKIGPDGCILVNKNKQTIVPNLFAAGDCVHGPKTVIAAITAGREAAKAIIKYLDKKDMEKAEAEQRKLIEEAIEKQKTNE
jgi:glutamate synthase (NADPH/NADH) small chain